MFLFTRALDIVVSFGNEELTDALRQHRKTTNEVVTILEEENAELTKENKRLKALLGNKL